jgi:hypothetical protein
LFAKAAQELVRIAGNRLSTGIEGASWPRLATADADADKVPDNFTFGYPTLLGGALHCGLEVVRQ